jgi:hypothetical protein
VKTALTHEEVQRYAPYHEITEFWYGFREYQNGCAYKLQKLGYPLRNSVAEQAYDRGAECAMRREHHA